VRSSRRWPRDRAKIQHHQVTRARRQFHPPIGERAAPDQENVAAGASPTKRCGTSRHRQISGVAVIPNTHRPPPAAPAPLRERAVGTADRRDRGSHRASSNNPDRRHANDAGVVRLFWAQTRRRRHHSRAGGFSFCGCIRPFRPAIPTGAGAISCFRTRWPVSFAIF